MLQVAHLSATHCSTTQKQVSFFQQVSSEYSPSFAYRNAGKYTFDNKHVHPTLAYVLIVPLVTHPILQAYHSQFNDGDYQSVGNMFMLPVKTRFRGNAPIAGE